MDDDMILNRGGTERDISEYARLNGADLTKEDFIKLNKQIVKRFKKEINSIASKLNPSNDTMNAIRLFRKDGLNFLEQALEAKDAEAKEEKEEIISFISSNEGWEDTEDYYRKHFGFAPKYKN
jgi:hypothetical protein